MRAFALAAIAAALEDAAGACAEQDAATLRTAASFLRRGNGTLAPERPATWSIAETAHALGLTTRTFRCRRPRLLALGFPPPLPGLRARYDPLAIAAWLARLRGEPGAPWSDGAVPPPRLRLRERALALAGAAAPE